MKIFSLGFFLVLSFSYFTFGQNVKPAVKPIPIETVINYEPTNEDKLIIIELQSAKNKLFGCFEELFKSKDETKYKILNECKEKTATEMVEIYGRLAKNPNALKLLIASEMESFSQDSSARFAGLNTSPIEINT